MCQATSSPNQGASGLWEHTVVRSDLQMLELGCRSKETLWELCQTVVIQVPTKNSFDATSVNKSTNLGLFSWYNTQCWMSETFSRDSCSTFKTTHSTIYFKCTMQEMNYRKWACNCIAICHTSHNLYSNQTKQDQSVWWLILVVWRSGVGEVLLWRAWASPTQEIQAADFLCTHVYYGHHTSTSF